MTDTSVEIQHKKQGGEKDAVSIFVVEILEIISYFLKQQSALLRLAEQIEKPNIDFDEMRKEASKFIRDRSNEVLDEDVLQRMFSVFQSGDRSKPREELLEEKLGELRQVINLLPPETRSIYREGYWRQMAGPLERVKFTSSALLITLISELEVTVRHLMSATTALRPEAILSDGKSITFSELKNFTTVDEVEQYLIDKCVDEAIRGSLENWLDFFTKHFGIKRQEVKFWPEIIEPMQRRHCHIHNRGKVSTAYLGHVRATDHSLGDELEVDVAYLKKAADFTYLFVYSLAWRLVTEFVPSNENAWSLAEQVIGGPAYWLLKEGRFSALVQLEGVAPLEKLAPRLSLDIQTNIWLAYKFSGRFPEVEQKVQEFDVRDRSISFQLAKAALLDQTDTAAHLIKVGLDTGELTKKDIVRWPLLKSAYSEYKLIYQDD